MKVLCSVFACFCVLAVTGCDLESPAFKELTQEGGPGGLGKNAEWPSEMTGSSGDEGDDGSVNSADATVGESPTTLAKFVGSEDANGPNGRPFDVSLGNESTGSAESQGKGRIYGSVGEGGRVSHVENVTGAERRECAELLGVEAQDVKSVFESGKYALLDHDILAIRVTGNGPALRIQLTGDDGLQVKGICLFVAGDQASVRVSFNSDVGVLMYQGRGNQSSGSIAVGSSHYLDRIFGSLAGNQAHFEVSGEGHYPQGDIKLSGNGSTYISH